MTELKSGPFSSDARPLALPSQPAGQVAVRKRGAGRTSRPGQSDDLAFRAEAHTFSAPARREDSADSSRLDHVHDFVSVGFVRVEPRCARAAARDESDRGWAPARDAHRLDALRTCAR